jgi:hypothetical protein
MDTAIMLKARGKPINNIRKFSRLTVIMNDLAQNHGLVSNASFGLHLAALSH